MFRHASEHVDSYYAHSCKDRLTHHPVLQDDLQCDVLVIGALASVVTRRLRHVARQRSDPGVVAGRHQGSAGPLQGWSHDQPR